MTFPDLQPANLTQAELPQHVLDALPLLQSFADGQAARYGQAVYLVGSALAASNAQPRDWDVRCILPDEQFELAYGPLSEWQQTAPFSTTRWRWAADCKKQTNLGWRMCPHLYLDFQTLPWSEANRALTRAAPRFRLDSAPSSVLADETLMMGCEPVHEWFGLSYCNHQVLSRTLLQSMPLVWQEQFVRLVHELADAFSHLDHPEYLVQAGRWVPPNSLSRVELKRLGWKLSRDGKRATNPDGTEHDAGREVLFIPEIDPIPHYDRGRARVALRGEREAQP